MRSTVTFTSFEAFVGLRVGAEVGFFVFLVGIGVGKAVGDLVGGLDGAGGVGLVVGAAEAALTFPRDRKAFSSFK